MTRSITITNTSNWAEEPVYVAGTILAPGESMAIGVDPPPLNVGGTDLSKMVKVMALSTTRDPLPFAEAEAPHYQVVPEVRVEWVPSTHEVKGKFQAPPARASS